MLRSRWDELVTYPANPNTKPDIKLTVSRLVRNSRKRKRGAKPQDCESLQDRPVKLVRLNPNKNLLETLPIPPLHNLTLATNNFLKYLARLDVVIAIACGEIPGVRPNPRRGNNPLSGFIGESLHSSLPKSVTFESCCRKRRV